MTIQKICTITVVAAIVAFSTSASWAVEMKTPIAAPPAPATEKCYGVAKAGKDVAIELPAGVCEKLANGSLVTPAPVSMKPVEKKM